MRAAAQYSLDHRDRLELRSSAVLSKQRERLAMERAHASLREERSDAKVNETPFFAIRIGRVAHQERHLHSLALCPEFLFPPIPPTP